MELRHLRYFVAVAEESHFRRAAQIVHVAQPALSQQIRQLEREIGVTLFERTHRQVRLTPAGEAFYLRANAILHEARQAVADARAVERGEAGTLTVGFVSSAAIGVLPCMLRQLRAQAPRAEVELKELCPGEQIEALHRERIDIGLLHASLGERTFATATVSREYLMAAVPRNSEHAKSRRVDLKELACETAIFPAPHATAGYFEVVRSAYQSAGVMPERVYHPRLLQTALMLVGAGLGVSLVPRAFKRIHVAGVVYRELEGDPPAIDLIAAWRRDNHLPLLARIVKDMQDCAGMCETIDQEPERSL